MMMMMIHERATAAAAADPKVDNNEENDQRKVVEERVTTTSVTSYETEIDVEEEEEEQQQQAESETTPSSTVDNEDESDAAAEVPATTTSVESTSTLVNNESMEDVTFYWSSPYWKQKQRQEQGKQLGNKHSEIQPVKEDGTATITTTAAAAAVVAVTQNKKNRFINRKKVIAVQQQQQQQQQQQINNAELSSRLSPEYTQRVLKYAQKRLTKSQAEPYYTERNRNNNNNILHIKHSHITLGTILGQGSFSTVYSVKNIKDSKSDDDNDVDDSTSTNTMSATALLDPTKIVVKVLRKRLLDKPAMLAACAADLIKEGLIMASTTTTAAAPNTHHGQQHILSVYGWTPSMLNGFQNGRHDAFFLVLEKLHCTLSHKLDIWRSRYNINFVDHHNHHHSFKSQQQQQQQQQQKKMMMNNKKQRNILKHRWFNPVGSKKNDIVEDEKTKKQDHIDDDDDNNDYDNISSIVQQLRQVSFWSSRLQCLVDLATGVEYLHTKRILHRDLKPDNIGFALNSSATAALPSTLPLSFKDDECYNNMGTLKVFDFDVARILPDLEEKQDPTLSSSLLPLYKLTKRVGSPRYMSPETARGELYNEKADVYTMALLCYELLSLYKPYHDIPPEDHDVFIFQGGARPTLPTIGNVNDDVGVVGHETPRPQRNNKKSKRKNQHSRVQVSYQKEDNDVVIECIPFWTKSLHDLLQRMWNEDIDQRPTMKDARESLQYELDHIMCKLHALKDVYEQRQHRQNEREEEAIAVAKVMLEEDSEHDVGHEQDLAKPLKTRNHSTSFLPFPRLWKSRRDGQRQNKESSSGTRYRTYSYGSATTVTTTSRRSSTIMNIPTTPTSNTSRLGLSSHYGSFSSMTMIMQQQQQQQQELQQLQQDTN